MTMFDDFIVRAAFAGLGVALAAAPLGCFVVWRRMAYVGDATAHAAILGVALSLAVSVPVIWGVLLVALSMAMIISKLSGRGATMDSLLGVLAFSGLAAGVVAASLLSSVRLDLLSYLFGDILAVSKSDVGVIWGGGVLVVGLLAWRWGRLLTATLSDDLAHAAGINPGREHFWMTLALAVVVAVAIKVVGALLIGALLIIPAAAARPWANRPEGMVAIAAGFGALASLGGLQLAFHFDTPTGATIVCTAAALFTMSLLGTIFVRIRR